jgi:thiamine-monophosphate kinase
MISDEKDRIRDIVLAVVGEASFDPPNLEDGSVQLVLGADARDDCAVLRFDGSIELVATTDYVRGPKFSMYELGLLDEYDLGYYLAIANLSDVAAMGAAPIGLLPVVRYPGDMDDEVFERCIAGIVDGARSVGATCIGGDIGSAERIILSATALGVCAPGRALRRSSAQPGDAVYVSGPIGRAGAAMLYFSARDAGRAARLSDEIESDLLASWRRPRARADIAQDVARTGDRVACQDISDGLKAAVEELAAASDVGALVERNSLPIPTSVRAVADLLHVDATALALSASVDFELLFAVADDTAASGVLEANGAQRIGRCTEDTETLLHGGDSDVPLPGVAWRHQDGDIVVTLQDGLER